MPATFIVPYDDFTYTPTNEDLIWLSVALLGEAGTKSSEEEYARVAWTWLNRFMLKTGRPWKSLKDLISNHSQPVKPAWRRDGRFCLPGGKGYGKGECDEKLLKRRDRFASIIASGDLTRVPDHIVNLAVDFLDGLVPEPPSDDGYAMVEFATNAVAQKHGTKYEPGGEWFLTSPQCQNTRLLKTFILDHVQVVGHEDASPAPTRPTTTKDSSSLGGFIFAVAGAVAAWLIWRRRT